MGTDELYMLLKYIKLNELKYNKDNHLDKDWMYNFQTIKEKKTEKETSNQTQKRDEYNREVWYIEKNKLELNPNT